jgi:hypothetical protein
MFEVMGHGRRGLAGGSDGLSQFGATLLGSDLRTNLPDAAVPLGLLLRQPSLVKGCLHALLPFFLMASEKDNARSDQANRGDQQKQADRLGHTFHFLTEQVGKSSEQ